VSYVQDYLNAVLAAARAGDWDELNVLIDVPSFVDFYIVQEFMKNPDVTFSSVFMTIRGQGDMRRLYMGPLWDFDLTSGNYDVLFGGVPTYHPQGLLVHRNHLYAPLMQMPEFVASVAERWYEISSVEVAQTIAHVAYTAAQFEDCFLRNFERHLIMGERSWNIPQHVREIDTFQGQVEFLITWLETRAAWLDEYFSQVL